MNQKLLLGKEFLSKYGASIKWRQYVTPLNKMKIVEGVGDELLEAGIIERSHSPWSFPIVTMTNKTARPDSA